MGASGSLTNDCYAIFPVNMPLWSKDMSNPRLSLTICWRRRRLLLIGAPPIICQRAADNLSVRRRCHFCSVGYLFCCNCRLMTKNRSSENFEDRTKFFREPLKNIFRAAPPTKIDQRAAADTKTSAQGSIWNSLSNPK